MPWSAFILTAVKDSALDIEGVAFRQDTLYFGIKNPLLDGKAVIVRVGNARRLFGAGSPADANIAFWKTWSLRDTVLGAAGNISDLHFCDDTLFLLSVAHDKKTGSGETAGSLWRYLPGTRQPELVRRFPGLKPEGVACNGKTGELAVVFDNGSARPSHMLTMRVEQ
jgi:hypothetical protein